LFFNILGLLVILDKQLKYKVIEKI